MSGQRRILGRSVARLEDLPLLRGQGQFVADIAFPHQLHMRIVRAPYAHGELRSVDVAAARAAPGVAAVWSGADIADLPPIDFRDPAGETLRPYRQPLLAQKRVRYVGEPVAAVFATDADRAEDAAELVSLTVEELAPVLDAAAAPSSFAPGLSTEAIVLRAEYGDLAGAFAKAHAVVELDLTIGRHSAVPLETRGALARYVAARDVLELYGAAKVPHRNRDALARMLGRSAAALVLKEGNTGGGFGVRGELYPEDFLVCLAALRLGRPVKWIEDRREHMLAGQPLARAAPSRVRRVRRGGPDPGRGGHILPRPRCLCAHAWRPGGGDDDGDGPRAVPRPCLSQHLPFPPHEQDAGSDLSSARAVRRHLRARAAHRRGRRSAWPRPGYGASAQPHHRGRNAVFSKAARSRHRNHLRFR